MRLRFSEWKTIPGFEKPPFVTPHGLNGFFYRIVLKYLLETHFQSQISFKWVFWENNLNWCHPFNSSKESRNWRTRSGEIIPGEQNNAFLKEKRRHFGDRTIRHTFLLKLFLDQYSEVNYTCNCVDSLISFIWQNEHKLRLTQRVVAY